ncbi:MAG: hypothetical protein ACLPSW_05090 [Roseiarcus sp.]|jgi:hypothetical protein
MNTSAFEAGSVDAVVDRVFSASTTRAGRGRRAPDALDERVYKSTRVGE